MRVELIMAQNRWTLKILALPVFDDAFAQAVLASPLADVAFVIAMDAKSATDFSVKVTDLAETFEAGQAETLCADHVRLQQFWTLATAASQLFLESTSFQLGFGLCDKRPVTIGDSPVSKLRKEAAIRSLVVKSHPHKKLKAVEPPATSDPLLEKENAEKAKWAGRLEAIAKRAGDHSKMFSIESHSDDLSTIESQKLKHLVLISGAPRTMSSHVRSFERFEHWLVSNGLCVYPISIDRVLKYALSLDQLECGPSVIPALRTSLKWVASRLAIDLPDLDDRRLRSLQEAVVSKRAKTLREAKPLPIEAVGALEFLVCLSEEPDASRLFAWWLLCMIFASLRFDDAIHVKPSELKMQEEGLFGVAWQTKVERKRAGTRFIVPNVGFKHSLWLQTGWELFNAVENDRDYWVHELNTNSEFIMRPPTHQRSVQWLRCLTAKAVRMDPSLDDIAKQQTLLKLQDLTAHSCRVTLLDAAVHAGRSTEEIGLQANWKNPGPLVLKYTRNRSSVPAIMIKQLVHEIVQEQHPVLEDENTVLTDAVDSDLQGLEFFIKSPAPGSYYDYKFHSIALGDSSSLACKRFMIEECSSVGSVLPDLSVLCKACARARPDIVRFLEET